MSLDTSHLLKSNSSYPFYHLNFLKKESYVIIIRLQTFLILEDSLVNTVILGNSKLSRKPLGLSTVQI